jgi:hypothetical protein
MNIIKSSKGNPSIGIENLIRERVFELLNRNSKVANVVAGQEYKMFGRDL